MSTKKKAAAAKPQKKTMTLRDGTTVERVGCFVQSAKDGKFERATAEKVAKSTCFAMTACFEDRDVTTLATVERTEHDNFVLGIPASSCLVTMVRREKEPGALALPEGVTLIGRGELLCAASLLDECWKAYADNFGIAKAYRMVDCHLVVTEKFALWEATFASALDVLK